TSYYRTAVLALAAAALVYGSLLAFRSADFRGVVAYSSLAQSGLIALGLFAGTDLGFDGAVLQMVAHGLISLSLFLVAGAVERRTTTGEFRLLGGMARGRPALATLLVTVGVIALAVPGSASFAGEFLVLAGVFQRAWWWAAIGAAAIVLAAMYMLRLISAVLHEARGSTVAVGGFTAGIVLAVWLYVDSATGHTIVSGAFYRDRWTALGQVILCAVGLATTLLAVEHVPGWSRDANPSRRDDHVAEFFALLLASAAGMG